MDFLPAGTATGNQDAARQGPVSQFFYLVANVMSGVDSQPRMEPGNVNNSGLVGPSPTFGIDVGVGADGQLYARGRAAPEQSNASAASTAASSPSSSQQIAGIALTPMTLLLAGATLWFLFGR